MTGSTSGNYHEPTPEEISVLGAVFSIVVVCVFGLGCYLLYLSFGQPAEKQDVAVQARWIAVAMMSGSILVKIRWVFAVLTWLDAARRRYLRR